MSETQRQYEELLQRVRKAALMHSCGSVLGWDRETYMPSGGAEHRSEQLSLLAGVAHDWSTDPYIGELLNELADSELNDGSDSDSVTNLREIRRIYERSVRLPARLVRETARVTALAQHHWAEARRQDDFSLFAPWLKQVLELKREEAAAVGSGRDGELYDALLDEYEPGATSREISEVFETLRSLTVPLLDELRGAARQPHTSILRRHYPLDAQESLATQAAAEIGFDFQRGRLDIATHPFCSGIGPGDCRLTTRYDENFFSAAFFGTLHEAGHGLYEQGLPADAFGTPMGSAVSLGIHESQSRLWENFVGRSPAFWRHYYPRTAALFPKTLAGSEQDAFVFAVNEVRPSLIRVEADEVTYNLHVMLRFDIERELIAGTLQTDDVPDAWNQRFERDFGFRPASDAEGCLQDVHWSAGLIGYFPTYALGNMYAAQFFDAAADQLGDLSEQLAAGHFSPLLEWLRQKIHVQGQRYRAERLVEVVTGERLSCGPLVSHLQQRFRPLYGLA